MSFVGLALWQAVLLIAATGAAIVGLYWLKPPPLRVPVASNLLWRRVLEERGRRSDLLRWWISVFLALTVGGLIASSLGRPELESAGTRRIAVVIDSSPTMATRSPDGRTRWDHATALARRLLGEGQEGSEYLIVDTSGQVAAPDFEDRETALGKLGRLQVSGARPPVFPRITFTSTSAFTADEAEVYFISDGVMVDPALAPPETKRVSVFEPTGNVGISTFDIRPVPANPLDYEAFLELVNGSADVEEDLSS